MGSPARTVHIPCSVAPMLVSRAPQHPALVRSIDLDHIARDQSRISPQGCRDGNAAARTAISGSVHALAHSGSRFFKLREQVIWQ
jgi:hypothetical protein